METNDSALERLKEEEKSNKLKREREEAEREAVMKATMLHFEKTKPDVYYAICAFSASNIGSSIGNLYENIARYIIADKLGVRNPLLKVINGSITIHKGVVFFNAQLIGELLYNKGYTYDISYQEESDKPKEKQENPKEKEKIDVKHDVNKNNSTQQNNKRNEEQNKDRKASQSSDYRLKAKATVTLIKKNDKGEIIFNKEYTLKGKDIPHDTLNNEKVKTWRDHFRLMLCYRALSYAVRLYAPDVLEGGNSQEEGQAYAEVESENVEEIKKLVEKTIDS